MLKSIELTYFNGENVNNCSIKLLYLDESLDISGLFEPIFLCNAIMVFETTTDNWFELWETIKYNKCANYLRKLRVSDTYTIK